MATIARYGRHYYIIRAMRLYKILYLNYFIARLFNLEIIIIFFFILFVPYLYSITNL